MCDDSGGKMEWVHFFLLTSIFCKSQNSFFCRDMYLNMYPIPVGIDVKNLISYSFSLSHLHFYQILNFFMLRFQPLELTFKGKLISITPMLKPQPSDSAHIKTAISLLFSVASGGGLVAKSHPTLRPYGPSPTRFLCPWDFPGKNSGVGCHFLFQKIFPTQGSKSGPCIASRFFTD